MVETRRTVLVVEDRDGLRRLYRIWLDKAGYDVEMTTGSAMFDVLTDDVDVLVVDRKMPGTTGDEILARLDDEAAPYRIVVVSAMDPDQAVAELPFDEYIHKPASREDLTAALDRVVRWRDFDPELTAYARTVSKVATLRRFDGREFGHSEAYRDLVRSLVGMHAELADAVSALSDAEFRTLFAEGDRAALARNPTAVLDDGPDGEQ